MVKQIHKEIYNAEKEIESLMFSINESSAIKADDDLNFAKTLGFNNIKNKLIKPKLDANEKFYNDIAELKNKYPFHKFITGKQIQNICKKYSLVIGYPDIFTSEIPQKNLKEIANFKMDDVDKHVVKDNFNIVVSEEWGGSRIANNNFKVFNCDIYNNGVLLLTTRKIIDITFRNIFEDVDILHNSINQKLDIFDYFVDHNTPTEYIINLRDRLNKKQTEEESIIVVGNVTDFNMKNKFVNKDNYITHEQTSIVIEPLVIDPIVLQRTSKDDIYAVMTAWGDEANDPSLINEIYN